MSNEEKELDFLDDASDNSSAFEKFISTNKVPVMFFLIGVVLIALGVLAFKGGVWSKKDDVMVLDAATESQESNLEVVVEIVGAVKKPGVYRVNEGSRIDDILNTAGGLTDDANTFWVDKTINRAAKVVDGQKIYIPRSDEQSEVSSANTDEIYQSGSSTNLSNLHSLVNINSANQSELEKLNGIGPVYATNIIEQRPYSDISELVKKDIIPQKTFEKIKDRISVY